MATPRRVKLQPMIGKRRLDEIARAALRSRDRTLRVIVYADGVPVEIKRCHVLRAAIDALRARLEALDSDGPGGYIEYRATTIHNPIILVCADRKSAR